VIVHFVYIGGIDDHHCLNFLFISKMYLMLFFSITAANTREGDFP